VSKAYIRDMLFVNTLEKRLGRKLTEEELESDELELTFPGKRREFVVIPRLLFPDDVMSSEAQIDLGFYKRDDVRRVSGDVDYMRWYNDERENTVESMAKTHAGMSGKKS
jgi:hypothetical protein